MKDRDGALIESFYQAILRADRWELLRTEVPSEFATSESNEFDCVLWTPVRQSTHVTEFEKIYDKVPGRMPKTFESCLMTFGWLPVEVGDVDLFPHHPQSGLKVFLEHVLRDKELFPYLFRERYVPFGRAAGGSYDPICFDLKRTKDRDCPLVRIDHESVLIDQTPVVTSELAPSFRVWLSGLE